MFFTGLEQLRRKELREDIANLHSYDSIQVTYKSDKLVNERQRTAYFDSSSRQKINIFNSIFYNKLYRVGRGEGEEFIPISDIKRILFTRVVLTDIRLQNR